MSIIQEALKKARDKVELPVSPQKENFQNNKSFDKGLLHQEVILSQKKFTPASPFFFFVFIVLAISLALTIGIFLFGRSKAENNRSRDKAEPKSEAIKQRVTYKSIEKVVTPQPEAKAAPLPPQRPIEIKAQPPELMLNGVMYLEGRPRAIINDSVIEEGDSISGATVRKINKDSVLLVFNDLEISINLK